jgi:hypothetical protein
VRIDDLVALRNASLYKKVLARFGRIVFLSNGGRPGWSKELPFYLFKCPNRECVNHKRFAVDYAHGFPGSNMRVTCPDCWENKYFPTWKYLLKDAWFLIKLRLRMIFGSVPRSK